MKVTRTTRETRLKAETLSNHLFGKVTEVCRHRIAESEQDAQSWITAVENKFNVTVK